MRHLPLKLFPWKCVETSAILEKISKKSRFGYFKNWCFSGWWLHPLFPMWIRVNMNDSDVNLPKACLWHLGPSDYIRDQITKYLPGTAEALAQGMHYCTLCYNVKAKTRLVIKIWGCCNTGSANPLSLGFLVCSYLSLYLSDL